MAKLSRAEFFTKWVPLLADNVFQDIDGARLAAFLEDLRDSAVWGNVPNVPVYDQFAVYAVGYLVRYALAGQPEGFYYARKAGALPAPTGGEEDVNWRAMPAPVAATVLSQALSLRQARSLVLSEQAASRVQPGRLYAIDLGLNRVYYVAGLDGLFDAEGTLVDDVGTRTKGSLDLATGTFTARAGGSGGGGSGVTPAQLAAVATTLPLSAVRGADGSLTADDIGTVVRASSTYPLVLTVPAGLGLPASANTGRVATVLSLGSGKVTLAFAAGVTPLYPAGSGPNLNGVGELSLLWIDTNTLYVKGGTP